MRLLHLITVCLVLPQCTQSALLGNIPTFNLTAPHVTGRVYFMVLADSHDRFSYLAHSTYEAIGGGLANYTFPIWSQPSSTNAGNLVTGTLRFLFGWTVQHSTDVYDETYYHLEHLNCSNTTLTTNNVAWSSRIFKEIGLQDYDSTSTTISTSTISTEAEGSGVSSTPTTSPTSTPTTTPTTAELVTTTTTSSTRTFENNMRDETRICMRKVTAEASPNLVTLYNGGEGFFYGLEYENAYPTTFDLSLKLIVQGYNATSDLAAQEQHLHNHVAVEMAILSGTVTADTGTTSLVFVSSNADEECNKNHTLSTYNATGDSHDETLYEIPNHCKESDGKLYGKVYIDGVLENITGQNCAATCPGTINDNTCRAMPIADGVESKHVTIVTGDCSASEGTGYETDDTTTTVATTTVGSSDDKKDKTHLETWAIALIVVGGVAALLIFGFITNRMNSRSTTYESAQGLMSGYDDTKAVL